VSAPPVPPMGWEKLADVPGDVTFGEWLAGELERHRIGIRNLARWAGLDHATVSRIARGDREPSLATAVRIVLAVRAWRRARGIR